MSTNRRIFERAIAIAGGLLGLVWMQEMALAQSILDFDAWMRKIERRSQSVQRSLARQDASAGSAEAREIGELYGSMETYFTRKGDSANAVKLSQEGRGLANTIVSSVTTHDFPAAVRSAQSLARACR